MKTNPRTRPITVYWSCAAILATQLAASAATLANRYSFNETTGTNCADSVGAQNGTLINGAAFTGAGQVSLNNLPGTSSADTSNPQYVALPPNLDTNLQSLTFEIWVTPTLDDATGGAFWARLWDFGNTDGVNGVNSFIYSRVGNSSFAPLADSFIAGLGDNWCFTSAIMLNGQENHWVWTADPVTHVQHVYLNGVVVGTATTFTNAPALAGPLTNCWLGRSQFAGDAALNGSLDEFRIYGGTLSPFEVAANYQNGPDTYPASFGTINSLQLQIAPVIGIGNSAPATVLAGASGLTNLLNITHNPEITIGYGSANTNIAKVDGSGNVTGVSVGAVNIVATYASVSATQSVQIIALPTTLIHRYSFNDGTANDSVGTANGTFFNTSGNSSIGAGQLNLAGAVGDYVDLGSNIITPTNIPNNSITLEGWATAYPVNGAWTRVFDFGTIQGGLGANYIFFAPNTAANGGSARVAVSDTSPGYLNEAGFNVGNILARTNIYFAVVFNPNPSSQTITLYENGNFVASAATGTRTLATINNVYSFLGRSTYSGDSWLSGAINEFRIYNGALDRFQVAASFQAGSETTNFNIGTFVSLNFNTGNSNMPVNQLRQSAVIINFSAATNINLIGDANLTLTSSDTNVLTISNGGVIRSPGIGTATLTASYKYVVGATTNIYTASATMNVFIADGKLVHRYSFNEISGQTAHDSIGGADGMILAATNTLSQTNYAWTGTGLTINADTNLSIDTFVELPVGIVSSLVSNATFEVWATEATSTAWQRIFDFGSVPASPTNAAQPNVFLARGPGGSTSPRYDWVNGNINSSVVWTNQTQAHIVVTHDGTDGAAKMYMNGALVASTAAQNEPLSSVNDIYCFLGRSIYSWPISLPGGFFDPYFTGTFNEFRIYKGLLTEAEILQDYAIGPDALITVSLAAALSGSNLVITWPTYGAHYALQSSPTLGPSAAWSPVTAAIVRSGSNYQVTLPHSGTALFFRLVHL